MVMGIHLSTLSVEQWAYESNTTTPNNLITPVLLIVNYKLTHLIIKDKSTYSK